ncbi:MAG: MBL fold metallo-hydrolase [Candidatus Heimdallarchaeota archaeon]|nr:MBL fold metallo-hydrolase [Candidatus Heimdallarchaeota archaeon]
MTEKIELKGFTHSYFLRIKNGYLLIDTSWFRGYKGFLRKIKRKKIQISDIKYILITHSHSDHTSFVNNLLQKSGAKLIAHEKALPRLKEGLMETDSKPINRAMRFLFKIANRLVGITFPKVTIEEERIIAISNEKDRDIPEETGLKGKLVSLPGHTDDSVSVILEDGRGFVGDLCTNKKWLFLGAGKRPPLILNEELLLKSWNKLRNYGVREIYPAHGKSFPIEKLR